MSQGNGREQMIGLMRLLFYSFIIYLCYQFFKRFFGKKESRTEVGGQRKSKPLDLKNTDVEDAHFEEIDEDKK